MGRALLAAISVAMLFLIEMLRHAARSRSLAALRSDCEVGASPHCHG